MRTTCVDFARNTRGNVAMIFALISVPLLLVGAFAIDSSRHLSSNQQLQAAIDAASLAGARALEDATKTDSEIEAIAQGAYKANLLGRHGDVTCLDSTVTVNRATGTVMVQASCKTPTLLGAGLTREDMDSVSQSTARANLTKLDLALMLDVSGSMDGQKLTDLKAAAKQTASTLITPTSGDRVRISFVSYAAAVNAGVYGNEAQGNPANDDSDGDGLDKVCVSERVGTAAWTDDEPQLGKYVGDEAGSCPDSSLLPLTYDLTAFDTAIDSLTAGGMTAGHLGVAWSWYLVAPDWDDVWPTASAPLSYTEPHSVKAVVLMTDGQFNMSYDPGMGDSNTQAKKMCGKMRDAGVRIYAVAFQAPTSAKNTLKNCTGDDSRFFDAGNGTELLAAYDAIASQLSQLTLVN
ncbi:MAG: pilus assembly protein [Hyphomonadaceae bacterium]|nr:pilus assembly protein [Hyphomonadaceae bacterium]